MKKFKIGFVINQDNIDIYKKNLIKFINNNTNFDQSILIKIKNKEENKSLKYFITRLLKISIYEKIINKILKKIINIIEINRIKKKKIFSDYGEKIKLKNLKLETFNIKLNEKEIFDKSELNLLQNQKIDILIFFDKNINDRDFLNISKLGALTLNKSDDRFIKSDVIGFWETYLNKKSIGFSINKISAQNELDNVLFRGNIRVRTLWHENKAMIDRKSLEFLKIILLKLSEKKFINKLKEVNLSQTKIIKNPSSVHLLKYMFREYSRIFLSRIHQCLGVKKKWSVSFSNETNIKINFKKFITIKNPPNRFLADPFIIKKNERNICFVEDYCFKKKKAKISAYELFHDNYKKVGTALEENFHLSFPYVFKHNNEVFMIPETGEINEIRLYKCTNFPLSWKFEKTLIKNIDAVDTIVFKDENKWYLLSNVCSSFINEHDSELHLYTSENLISENWIRSENNPIIFNTEKGRNGGFFNFNGSFYRVNQVHKKNQYGYSLKINKVVSINENSYQELEVNEIKPIFLNSLIGTHHFHMNEEFTVIDHLSTSYRLF
ncbi:hypothetical protein N9441_02935 [Candidatus Pelagibacter sp.]|nr:hypothetical protein [Candidatus Pelagibacter sp.]